MTLSLQHAAQLGCSTAVQRRATPAFKAAPAAAVQRKQFLSGGALVASSNSSVSRGRGSGDGTSWGDGRPPPLPAAACRRRHRPLG
jgi:hypothetical protein